MPMPLHGLRRAFATFALMSAGLLFASPTSAQSCQSTMKVDTSGVVTLQPWDGSQSPLVMSCSEAEEMRGAIFRTQLAFLSQSQQITAAKVNAEIASALEQLNKTRQALAAVKTAQQAQSLSATMKSLRWLAAKTKLLICSGLTFDSGGLALATACGKVFVDFLKDSVSTFQTFASAAEAQERAAELQQIITQMNGDVAKLQLTTIPGTATPQRFAVAFESMCAQIKNSCLRR